MSAHDEWQELARQVVLELIAAGELQPKRWMNTDETAAYLGMSRTHLEARRRQKKPPQYHRFGNKVIRYDRLQVDQFILDNPGDIEPAKPIGRQTLNHPGDIEPPKPTRRRRRANSRQQQR